MSDHSDSQPSPSSSSGTSRRRLFTLMGAGGAAIVASQLPRKDALAGHDGTNIMHLGEQNDAPFGSISQINANVAGPTLVLHNENDSDDASVLQCDADVGISGRLGVDDPVGPRKTIEAGSHGGTAVEGASFPTDILDPEGEPQLGIGVRGLSHSAEGGYGEGPGVGVHGQSRTGVGVLGTCTGAGRGVNARSDSPDGMALVVEGKSGFSTAGSALIPAGENSVFVADADVTGEDSHISVTLVSDPGPRTIRWVERDPGSGFTVHLSPAPVRQRPETHLTYLIVEGALPGP